jgi:hypothetical protein
MKYLPFRHLSFRALYLQQLQDLTGNTGPELFIQPTEEYGNMTTGLRNTWLKPEGDGN